MGSGSSDTNILGGPLSCSFILVLKTKHLNKYLTLVLKLNSSGLCFCWSPQGSCRGLLRSGTGGPEVAFLSCLRVDAGCRLDHVSLAGLTWASSRGVVFRERRSGQGKASCGLGLESSQCHFCHILLVRVNRKASPMQERGTRSCPFDGNRKKSVAIQNLTQPTNYIRILFPPLVFILYL